MPSPSGREETPAPPREDSQEAILQTWGDWRSGLQGGGISFPASPGPGTMGKSQVQVTIRWLIYWCDRERENMDRGPAAHTDPQNCTPSLVLQNQGWHQLQMVAPFLSNETRPDGRLALGKAPDQVLGSTGHQHSTRQYAGPMEGGGALQGAGVGHPGQTVPIVLSTAHRFIQEPRVKCTSGSRVDSALNSSSGSLAEPRRLRGVG